MTVVVMALIVAIILGCIALGVLAIAACIASTARRRSTFIPVLTNRSQS